MSKDASKAILESRMKLSELIAIVGDENVTFQTIATDMHSANIHGKDGKITFFTDPKMVKDILLNKPKFTGLIVWIPNELIPESIK